MERKATLKSSTSTEARKADVQEEQTEYITQLKEEKEVLGDALLFLEQTGFPIFWDRMGKVTASSATQKKMSTTYNWSFRHDLDGMQAKTALRDNPTSAAIVKSIVKVTKEMSFATDNPSEFQPLSIPELTDTLTSPGQLLPRAQVQSVVDLMNATAQLCVQDEVLAARKQDRERKHQGPLTSRQLAMERNKVVEDWAPRPEKDLVHIVPIDDYAQATRISTEDVRLFKYPSASAPSGNDPRTFLQSFLRLMTCGWFQEPDLIHSEMTIERAYGGMMQGFAEIQGMKTLCNQELPQLHLLGTYGSIPHPDIATRTDIPQLQARYQLVTLGGEAKLRTSSNIHLPAQLACTFQASLNLLLIMEHHKHPNTPAKELVLPAWFWLVGFSYDINGVVFYAHFPSYDTAADKWGYVSLRIFDFFSTEFGVPEDYTSTDEAVRRSEDVLHWKKRIGLLRAMLIVQAHAAFVKDQLTEIFKSNKLTKIFPPAFTKVKGEYGPAPLAGKA